MGVTAEQVKSVLLEKLEADEVKVEEISGCGSSFEVHVVSCQFEGKRILDRQRLVNAALAELMGDIHALSIKKCWTPAQQAAAAVPS